MLENETTTETVEVANIDPFKNESWSETPPEEVVDKKPDVVETKIDEPAKEVPIVAETKEPIIETKTEPVVEVKKEEPKPAAAEAVKSKLNPLVERLLQDASDDEVLNFLQTKKELSKIESLSPADILKLQIKHTNKDYNAQDIADVFEEKYSIPEKPVQDEIEEDNDFASRLSKWEDAKAKVDRRIERDARTAKVDLARINGELVIPKAPEPEVSSQQKDLEAQVQKARETFIKGLESDYKNFDGYKVAVTYKDKDVDVQIPIDFKPTEEEKAALKSSLEDFDSSEYLGNRWFNKDGTPNITEMMQDKYLLDNKAKIFTKIANDAAAKRLEAFINEQKNIKVGSGAQTNLVTQNAKSEIDAMADALL